MPEKTEMLTENLPQIPQQCPSGLTGEKHLTGGHFGIAYRQTAS